MTENVSVFNKHVQVTGLWVIYEFLMNRGSKSRPATATEQNELKPDHTGGESAFKSTPYFFSHGLNKVDTLPKTFIINNVGALPRFCHV